MTPPPGDAVATAGVGFTVNHIAAVTLPALFGLLWLVSPALVFLSGAAMAGVSLLLATNVPRDPAPGREVAPGRGVKPERSCAVASGAGD